MFYFIYKLINWNSFELGLAPIILGIFILGLVLQYLNFDPNIATNSGSKPPINELVFFQITVGPFLTLIGTSFLFLYNISRDSHYEAIGSLGYEEK